LSIADSDIGDEPSVKSITSSDIESDIRFAKRDFVETRANDFDHDNDYSVFKPKQGGSGLTIDIRCCSIFRFSLQQDSSANMAFFFMAFTGIYLVLDLPIRDSLPSIFQYSPLATLANKRRFASPTVIHSPVPMRLERPLTC
jgi:hypothetical protein